jgi:hemolysin III
VTWTDYAGAGAISAAGFLDARRGIYYAKPAWRGWLHLICFGMSLAAGTLLVASTHGTERITSGAIYATSVSAMFGVSALYHRGTWTEAWRRRMQRLDHVMIFFLIAGTATPVLLLAMPGTFGLAWLIVVWTLAGAAAAIHLRWMSAPELLVGATFGGLGWAAGLALPGVWIHAGAGPAGLVPASARCIPPGRCAIAAAVPTPPRRCSATTRFSMPSYAPLQPASTLRSPGFSDNRPGRAAGRRKPPNPPGSGAALRAGPAGSPSVPTRASPSPRRG